MKHPFFKNKCVHGQPGMSEDKPVEFQKCAALAEAEKKTVKLTMIRIRPKTKDMIHFLRSCNMMLSGAK